jgi:hypothetical protein
VSGDNRPYVLVACPPGEELARGKRRDCEYVRRVLEDLRQVPGREYVVMTAKQWDEEAADV